MATIRVIRNATGWAVQTTGGVIPGMAFKNTTFDTKSEAISHARSLGDGTDRIVADKANVRLTTPLENRSTEVIREGR